MRRNYFFIPVKGVVALGFAGIFLSAATGSAFEEPALGQKIRNIKLGMRQEEVVNSLGEPQAVVSKYADVYGRPVEVWRYLSRPGTIIPAQTLFSGTGSDVTAEVLVPRTSAATDDAATRVKREFEFWDRVQKAGMSNPSDPLYKPVLHKLPPRTAANTSVYDPTQVYFVTFVNGEVQSVNLSDGAQPRVSV